MVKRTKLAKRKKRNYSLDVDAGAAAQIQEGGGGFDSPFRPDVKSFKPTEGNNRIRIMPRTWDENEGPRLWSFPVAMHYNVGADNGRYLCPVAMGWERSCPICAERARLSNEGDDESAKQLKPRIAQATWVIDRSEEEAGPKLWLMPPSTLAGVILSLSVDEDTRERLIIEDPEEGFDVSFRRKGTALNTKYDVVKLHQRPCPLSDDDELFDEWLDYIEENTIPSICVKHTSDHIAMVLNGGVDPDDDDDDEEEDAEPVRTRRRPKAKPEPEPEEDEEDEDDDDEYEDDDDSLDNIDEPDDDDDDDEEEAPRKKRGSASSAKKSRSDLRNEVTSAGLSKRKRRGR